MVGEHEWEFAARGGLVAARYPWGEHFKRNKTNLWQVSQLLSIKKLKFVDVWIKLSTTSIGLTPLNIHDLFWHNLNIVEGPLFSQSISISWRLLIY